MLYLNHIKTPKPKTDRWGTLLHWVTDSFISMCFFKCIIDYCLKNICWEWLKSVEFQGQSGKAGRCWLGVTHSWFWPFHEAHWCCVILHVILAQGPNPLKVSHAQVLGLIPTGWPHSVMGVLKLSWCSCSNLVFNFAASNESPEPKAKTRKRKRTVQTHSAPDVVRTSRWEMSHLIMVKTKSILSKCFSTCCDVVSQLWGDRRRDQKDITSLASIQAIQEVLLSDRSLQTLWCLIHTQHIRASVSLSKAIQLSLTLS